MTPQDQLRLKTAMLISIQATTASDNMKAVLDKANEAGLDTRHETDIYNFTHEVAYKAKRHVGDLCHSLGIGKAEKETRLEALKQEQTYTERLQRREARSARDSILR